MTLFYKCGNFLVSGSMACQVFYLLKKTNNHCLQKPSTCTKHSVSDCIRDCGSVYLCHVLGVGVASPVSCEMDRHSFLVGIKMAASLFPLALSLSLNALNGDVCVLELDAVYVFPLEMRINVVWVGVAGGRDGSSKLRGPHFVSQAVPSLVFFKLLDCF